MTSLLLAVALAQAPVGADAALEVAKVELRLPAGLERSLVEKIRELVTVRKGQRLSRRQVRRSIEGLFELQRFADVVVHVEPAGEGVAVVFEVYARRLVADVYFEALPRGSPPVAGALQADLLAAGRLGVGSEYWSERGAQAAEAMAELLRRRGFREADVRHDVSDGEQGLAVGFIVSTGAPTTLQALSVVGDPGLPIARVLEATRLSTGQVLDLDEIQRGVEALRAVLRRERFYRARVDVPEVFDGGRLVLPVRAGPRFDVVFSGNRRLTDATLSAVLGYEGEELLDGSLASRLAARLARFYRFRGFHDVRVTGEERRGQVPGRAALGFVIDESDPLRVVEVRFDGARAVSAAELRDVLARVVEGAAPSGIIEAHGTGDPLALEGRAAPIFARDLPAPPPSTVYEPEAWAEALKAMTALYRERGYLSAEVVFDGIERTGAQGVGQFTVREGPQATFRLVQSQGFPRGFRSDTIALVKTGSPFTQSGLDRVRDGVQRELNRRGYLYAQVEAAYTLDASRQHADCVVKATPGPQVRVRTVVPVGAARTNADVILRQATMTEGQPLDSETLYSTQSALLGTGAFRTAEVEMLAPERAEPLKTVLLKVRERARLSGEIGVGYFVADGPRVVLDAAAPNLGGRAVNLAFRAQVNYFALSLPARTGLVDLAELDPFQAEDARQGFERLPLTLAGRGNLSLQNRGLLPFDIGWRLDAVGERVFRPQFRFTRWAAIPSLDWARTVEIPRVDNRLKVTLALQYELEWARVTETSSVGATVPLTFVDQERLRFLFGTFALQTVRFAPTFDFRDNALAPRTGGLLQGSTEFTGALYAGTPLAPGSEVERPVPVSFFKVSGLATGYVPLGPRVVLALSLRGGRIVPLVADSVTPPVKRFFLGGATSMRGFNEDQLIAEDQRAQYRGEVANCQVLANESGCTTAARTIAEGRQVPSQGGEFFGLGKAELRFPGFGAFDLGLFVEVGNLWLALPTGIGRLRTVLGAGLRYATPIGPLALDVGWNLDADGLINEPPVVLHFNIGVF
ncbi:MAG: BamA/TamA family outer membrane protein [Myxococcaceae bacterium]|nr:BamA/TamA family outer membrane protein [Myxococcaceae bacterium]